MNQHLLTTISVSLKAKLYSNLLPRWLLQISSDEMSWDVLTWPTYAVSKRGEYYTYFIKFIRVNKVCLKKSKIFSKKNNYSSTMNENRPILIYLTFRTTIFVTSNMKKWFAKNMCAYTILHVAIKYRTIHTPNLL